MFCFLCRLYLHLEIQVENLRRIGQIYINLPILQIIVRDLYRVVRLGSRDPVQTLLQICKG